MAVVILDDEARLARKLWHKSLTDEVLIETMERRMSSLDDPGFCLLCGCEAYGIDPDGRRLTCDGVEELIMAADDYERAEPGEEHT